MREGELTYDDFLRRLNIQDVLIDAGYHLNRRDGLRYPSYVRLDSEGRRIRNDKFIVTQQGKCCFKPQQQKSYNIISFIKEHPHFFAEYHAGVSPDRLVNLVCNQLLNHPVADRDTRIIQPKRDVKRLTWRITTFTSSIRRIGRHKRSSIRSSSIGASTFTRNTPSTGTFVWRRNTVRTA